MRAAACEQQPLGAASDPVTLFGGETVTFTIQPDLVASFASVG
jgi:hypothetical protein